MLSMHRIHNNLTKLDFTDVTDYKCGSPGGCGRGEGQTVFWSIEVKRIFAKQGTKKSLEKKRVSKKGFSTAIMHYAFFLH